MFLLNLGVVAGSVYSVIWIDEQQEDLKKYAVSNGLPGALSDLVPTIAISGINAALPTVTKLIVKLSAYDFPETEITHVIGRNFLKRMLNLSVFIYI